MSDLQRLPYREIPGMPLPSVSGHSGALVVGDISGKRLLCFSGRVHAYEGYDFHVLGFSARLAAAVGCKLFIATNAAGLYLRHLLLSYLSTSCSQQSNLYKDVGSAEPESEILSS